MSDHNHIIYTAADIEDYWAGRLSPAEMNRMERAALNDPFLADAMEGYKSVPSDHIQNIEVLKSHLHRRLHETKSPAAPSWLWLKIAAAIFVLAGAGLIWMTYLKDLGLSKQMSAADNTQTDTAYITAETAKASESTATFSDSEEKKSTVPEIIGPREEESVSANKKVSPPTTPLMASPEEKKVYNAEPLAKQSAPALSRSVDTFSAEPVYDKTADYLKKQNDTGKFALPAILYGRVYGITSKPIQNVTVSAKDQTTVTDHNGYFAISTPDSVIRVQVSSIGFVSKELTLNKKNAGITDITLTPAQTTLNEVVIGNSTARRAKKEITVAVQQAEPVIGWNDYNRYLDSAKIILAGGANIHGDVVVAFQVDNKGVMRNFRAIKKLHPAADDEAIRLIKYGPPWQLLKGRKADATVIVKF
ncbi:MAG: carboxypeptidase-like regulatory domain-containing protein [Gemmatimonadaceae bacterium]|nr:carboxypeptidase-like regulatory domain-containing protein [Chitinophagaceae bacterium]